MGWNSAQNDRAPLPQTFANHCWIPEAIVEASFADDIITDRKKQTFFDPEVQRALN